MEAVLLYCIFIPALSWVGYNVKNWFSLFFPVLIRFICSACVCINISSKRGDRVGLGLFHLFVRSCKSTRLKRSLPCSKTVILTASCILTFLWSVAPKIQHVVFIKSYLSSSCSNFTRSSTTVTVCWKNTEASSITRPLFILFPACLR